MRIEWLAMGALLCAGVVRAELVPEVRAAAARGDLAAAERRVAAFRAARGGATPELAEAVSWLARGALAAKAYDKAEAYATESRKLVLGLLARENLDEVPRLSIALGASIEVQARVLANHGRRAEAIAFLREEVARWRNTSIRTRIQKNLNLLTLEGKAAPPLRGFAIPRGRPALIFFWAHWCGECKGEAPVVAEILRRYGPAGLAVVAPTQRYGYVAGGNPAGQPDESRYIQQVWKQYYPALAAVPVPMDEVNLAGYGVSTTPTFVLVDRQGIVRLYHPGTMSYIDLAGQVARCLGD